MSSIQNESCFTRFMAREELLPKLDLQLHDAYAKNNNIEFLRLLREGVNPFFIIICAEPSSCNCRSVFEMAVEEGDHATVETILKLTHHRDQSALNRSLYSVIESSENEIKIALCQTLIRAGALANKCHLLEAIKLDFLTIFKILMDTADSQKEEMFSLNDLLEAFSVALGTHDAEKVSRILKSISSKECSEKTSQSIQAQLPAYRDCIEQALFKLHEEGSLFVSFTSLYSGLAKATLGRDRLCELFIEYVNTRSDLNEKKRLLEEGLNDKTPLGKLFATHHRLSIGQTQSQIKISEILVLVNQQIIDSATMSASKSTEEFSVLEKLRRMTIKTEKEPLQFQRRLSLFGADYRKADTTEKERLLSPISVSDQHQHTEFLSFQKSNLLTLDLPEVPDFPGSVQAPVTLELPPVPTAAEPGKVVMKV